MHAPACGCLYPCPTAEYLSCHPPPVVRAAGQAEAAKKRNTHAHAQNTGACACMHAHGHTSTCTSVFNSRSRRTQSTWYQESVPPLLPWLHSVQQEHAALTVSLLALPYNHVLGLEFQNGEARRELPHLHHKQASSQGLIHTPGWQKQMPDLHLCSWQGWVRPYKAAPRGQAVRRTNECAQSVWRPFRCSKCLCRTPGGMSTHDVCFQRSHGGQRADELHFVVKLQHVDVLQALQVQCGMVGLKLQADIETCLARPRKVYNAVFGRAKQATVRLGMHRHQALVYASLCQSLSVQYVMRTW